MVLLLNLHLITILLRAYFEYAIKRNWVWFYYINGHLDKTADANIGTLFVQLLGTDEKY